ncbi:MAG: hypothetical protein ACK4PR_14050, partial [Gammaproteobacteria bacterium]
IKKIMIDNHKTFFSLPYFNVIRKKHRALELHCANQFVLFEIKQIKKEKINCLVELNDGRVISGSQVGSIKIWNLYTGECETLIDYGKSITRLTLLSDGKVLSINQDNILEIWNLQISQREKILHKASKCLAVLNDDRIIIVDTDDCFEIINLQTGFIDYMIVPTSILGQARMTACLATLNNKQIIRGRYDGVLEIWNIQTLKCEQIFSGKHKGVSCLSILDANRILSGGHSNLKIWNIQTLKCEQTLTGYIGTISCLTVLTNDRIVSVDEDSLKIWNLQTKVFEYAYACKDLQCLIALANGNLVSGYMDGAIRILKRADYQLTLLPLLTDKQQVPSAEVMIERDGNDSLFFLNDELIKALGRIQNELGLKNFLSLTKVRINNHEVDPPQTTD